MYVTYTHTSHCHTKFHLKGHGHVRRIQQIDNTYNQHGRILKGWDAVDKRIRDSDEIKVEDFKEDVDTLLVFVSLLIFAIEYDS